MTAFLDAAVVPDPAYLVIPFGATLGGLLSSLRAWVREPHPDWPKAWVLGNIWGSASGSLFVTIFYGLGVIS